MRWKKLRDKNDYFLFYSPSFKKLCNKWGKALYNVKIIILVCQKIVLTFYVQAGNLYNLNLRFLYYIRILIPFLLKICIIWIWALECWFCFLLPRLYLLKIILKYEKLFYFAKFYDLMFKNANFFSNSFSRSNFLSISSS